jgi:hypothetical protein
LALGRPDADDGGGVGLVGDAGLEFGVEGCEESELGVFVGGAGDAGPDLWCRHFDSLAW